LSNILACDDDGANDDEQNDVNIPRIKQGGDKDSEKLQAQLTDLFTEHADIFSYSVKGPTDVSPMEFTVDKQVERVGATEWHRDRSQ
jgi:hypothetical protein